jgi:hypothetical protein
VLLRHNRDAGSASFDCCAPSQYVRERGCNYEKGKWQVHLLCAKEGFDYKASDLAAVFLGITTDCGVEAQQAMERMMEVGSVDVHDGALR